MPFGENAAKPGAGGLVGVGIAKSSLARTVAGGAGRGERSIERARRKTLELSVET
jgi:hypothetical protein